jgi:hypothetical protein
MKPAAFLLACIRVALLAIMLLVIAPPAEAVASAGTHAAQSPPTADASGAIRATSERGLVGEVIVADAPKPLRAKPEQPISAPILVRVNEVRANEVRASEVRGGAGAAAGDAGNGIQYRIEFIGAVAGTYDLRDSIEYVDGTPVTDLAPILVRVESQLPVTHGSDLFAVPEPPFRLESHYRTMLWVVGALWLVIPIIVLIRRRLLRPAPVEVVPPAPQPTLADVLRPLVERAQREGLSMREQASLELLLLHYWRDRLGIADAPAATAIATLRAHPEAGTLIRAVERWLHAPGAGDARPAEDIAALLAPYVAVEAPRAWPPAPSDQSSPPSAPRTAVEAAHRASSEEVRR